MSSQNLDQLCARYGHEMATSAKDENHITKSLGVLQENGVYSFFLYQESKRTKAKDGKGPKTTNGQVGGLRPLGVEGSEEKKNPAAAIVSELAAKMLREQDVSFLPPGEDVLAAVRNLAEDIDNLLLAKRLLEQALIYARYHAKALDSESKSVERNAR